MDIEESSGKLVRTLYDNDLQKAEVLPSAEIVELVLKAQEGDRSALDKVVKSNLLFVVKVANQFKYRGVPIEDLISEGNLGLTSAVYSFDANKGVTFLSYAVWFIRRNITEAIYSSDIVRVPVAAQAKVRKVLTLLGPEPKLDHIQSLFGWTKDSSQAVYDAIYRRMDSLDQPINEDKSRSTVSDVLGYDDPEIADMLGTISHRTILDDASSILTEKERFVVWKALDLDGEGALSMAEIGVECGLSGERVRQLKTRSLKKLRSFFPKDLLT